MVKQNSQVSEGDGKVILNSMRSKQETDVNGKFKSANIMQEGKELKNFVRQLKPPPVSKNPN